VPGDPVGDLILVDTSAYFALVDKSDRHHSSAVAFIRSNTIPLATTDLILVETLNLVRARLEHSHAVRLGRQLLNPALTTVLKVSDEDMARRLAPLPALPGQGFFLHRLHLLRPDGAVADCDRFRLRSSLPSIWSIHHRPLMRRPTSAWSLHA